MGRDSGLAVTMARSFTYKIPFLTVAFIAFFGLAVIGFLVCLVLLGRAYLAQTYEYLPLLADLDQSAEEFREFNAYVRSTGGEVEDTFAGDLRQRIIKAADRNTLSNDLRSKWLHYSRIMLFVVLGFTVLAVVPYVADQRINARERHADTRGSEACRPNDHDPGARASKAHFPREPGDQGRPRAGQRQKVANEVK